VGQWSIVECRDCSYSSARKDGRRERVKNECGEGLDPVEAVDGGMGCGVVLMGNWSRVKPKTCVRQPNRMETQHRNREQKDRQDKDKARRQDDKLEER
jgi:hypothetical protein